MYKGLFFIEKEDRKDIKKGQNRGDMMTIEKKAYIEETVNFTQIGPRYTNNSTEGAFFNHTDSLDTQYGQISS